jgi:hypothetical protein
MSYNKMSAPRKVNAFALYLKRKTPEVKKEMGAKYTAPEAMKLIARMYRREHGLASPAPKAPKSPKGRKAKSPKSVLCDETWVAKCAQKGKVCRTSPNGRRACAMTADEAKAKAKALAQRRRANKAAGLSPKPRGRPARVRVASF